MSRKKTSRKATSTGTPYRADTQPVHERAKNDPARALKPIQFNWRRHWSKKVAPYLQEELVQVSLELGMRMLDPDWKRGDAPCALGAIGFNRIVTGKLSWYQPLNRCHHIAFFAMAIGVLNYPDLDWRFVSGDRHTVPVGYDSNGNPRVVMDILLFGFRTANESIALAQEDFPPLKAGPKVRKVWRQLTGLFVSGIVSALKTRARELHQARNEKRGSGTATGRKKKGRKEAHGSGKRCPARKPAGNKGRRSSNHP
jgi:hypothetical protein